MDFAEGARELQLNWRPLDLHEQFVQDRAVGSDELDGVAIAGEPARVFSYGARDGGVDLTALWRHGDHSLEARALMADEAEFAGVLAALTEVDVDRWLSAMPASVVRPDVRDDMVAEMLQGVPLPPGFDAGKLGSDGVADRYTLGAQVMGAVSCGWIESWFDATASGDAATAEAAVAAMGTSRDWAILHEMQAEGDYSVVVWGYADAIAGHSTGEEYSVADDGYSQGLGCNWLEP